MINRFIVVDKSDVIFDDESNAVLVKFPAYHDAMDALERLDKYLTKVSMQKDDVRTVYISEIRRIVNGKK